MTVRPVRRWHVTGFAAHRALGGVALVVVGLVAGRPDVAAFGIPLLAGLVWAAFRPPAGHPEVQVEPARHRAGSDVVDAALTIGPVAGVDAVRIRVSSPGHRSREAMLDARDPRPRRMELHTVRTGRQETFRVDHVALGPEGLYGSDPAMVPPGSIILLPRAHALTEVPLPFRLQGVTGGHASRRPGDGGDLRDVARFGPGDRLRRIDWRTTARRGTQSGTGTDLYVRRTFATADAHVVVVLDPRDAVGPDVATWGTGRAHPDQATSLDLARHAAASIARHCIEQGDRVGLVDLGRNQRPLLPATGRRHLQRILHHLAVAEPNGEPGPRVRPPQVPSGVLVVLCSTFLDDVPARMATEWRHDGHRVVAFDVLPTPDVSRLHPHARTAMAMVMLERADRLAELASTGVEVVRWPAEGAPTAALRALARTRRR